MSIAQQNETTKPNNASNDQNSRKELFRKVLRMFSDRHVAGVHVRQARAISRACSAVTDGVHYNELEYFVKMLDYCSCRSIMPECCSVTPNEKEKENRPSTNPNVQKRERQSKSALPLERKEETLFELKSDNRTSSAENKMRLTISTPTLTSEVQSESKVLDQTNDIIIENEEKSTTELEKETNETQNDTKAIEEIVTLYRPSVLAVLKCLHKPFIKDKVSDQQTYRKDILELLTKVIQVFSTNNISEDLQTEAVILLASLLTFTPTAFFVDVFSEAKIVQALANALHTSKGKLTIAILSTLCDCTFQKKLAQEIRHSNTVIEDVICHFSHGIRSLGFDISVELLWNILENANNPMQSIDLKLWVNSLKSAFTEIMKHGVSLLDKTTRNEVLLLTSYAARDERTHTFFASLGYLDDVMLYLTIIEQNKLNTLQNKNFLMAFNNHDFEMKKLLMFIVMSLAKSKECVDKMLQYRLFDYLFVHFHASNHESTLKWLGYQIAELRKLILQLIQTVAHSVPNFPSKDQIKLLYDFFLETLNATKNSDSFLSSTIEKQGTQKTQTKQIHSKSEFAQNLLIPLINTLTTCAVEAKGFIGDLGAIEFSIKTVENDNIADTVRTHLFSLLSMLCNAETSAEDAKKNRERFSELKGVVVCLPFIQSNPNDPYHQDELSVSVIDLIGNSVVCSNENSKEFVENDGVLLLLDHIECCSTLLRNQSLSVLSDMCKQVWASNQAREWLSQRDFTTTLSKLLIKFWKEEETRLGVQSDKGLLKKHSPLESAREQTLKQMIRSFRKGEQTKLETTQQIASVRDNFAISTEDIEEVESPTRPFLKTNIPKVSADLINSVYKTDQRDKIFGLFHALGFPEFLELEFEERITYVLIQNYQKLREGEIVEAIAEDLQAEAVTLIEEDQKLIETRLNEYHQTIEFVRERQMELLKTKENEDLDKERNHYKELMLLKQDRERERQRRAQAQMKNRGAFKAYREQKQMLKESTRVGSSEGQSYTEDVSNTQTDFEENTKVRESKEVQEEQREQMQIQEEQREQMQIQEEQREQMQIQEKQIEKEETQKQTQSDKQEFEVITET